MDFIVHNNIVINAKFSELADCIVVIQSNISVLKIHARILEVKCHDAYTQLSNGSAKNYMGERKRKQGQEEGERERRALRAGTISAPTVSGTSVTVEESEYSFIQNPYTLGLTNALGHHLNLLMNNWIVRWYTKQLKYV